MSAFQQALSAAGRGKRLRLAVLDLILSFPPVIMPVKRLSELFRYVCGGVQCVLGKRRETVEEGDKGGRQGVGREGESTHAKLSVSSPRQHPAFNTLCSLSHCVPPTRAAGVPVLVDGAHSVGALLDLKVPQLGADYFVSTLHKWLCTPKVDHTERLPSNWLAGWLVGCWVDGWMGCLWLVGRVASQCMLAAPHHTAACLLANACVSTEELLRYALPCCVCVSLVYVCRRVLPCCGCTRQSSMLSTPVWCLMGE